MCAYDEGCWPLAAGKQMQAANPLQLRKSRASVVSVKEKARREPRQVRIGKTNTREPLCKCRKIKMRSKPDDYPASGIRALERAAYCQSDLRHKDGVSPVQAYARNLRTWALLLREPFKREAPVRT
jgi:hypothetical protein